MVVPLTIFKFYQDSWLNLVDAIASLIEQDSEYVFDALDSKTEVPEVNGINAKADKINYRDEPVAFFFVLFGIVFEALITKPSSNSPVARQETLEILSALKKILRPSVSGNAIYQDVIFSETMELLDRLVLTEGLDVQAVIVEIARNLCLGHPSAKEGQNSGENLSDDVEQLFELTRIIVLVLAGLMPNLTDSKLLTRHHLNDEANSLIRLSLDALVDAAEVFPSIIKTDLHACIIHIFATIFGTGACQTTIVPQALPIFKRFIQGITRNANNDAVVDQIRGCLKRFLLILSNAQKRETEASLPCAKNMLLASTILLTSSTSVLPPNDPLITTLLNEMLDCLHDLGLAKVAANCIRSLLLVAPKTPTDQATARHLLSRLLAFVTHTSSEDPENARTLIAHTLTSFVPTLSAKQIPTALTLVIPALLFRAASSEGKSVYKETAARLLELAGTDQAAFRGVVGQMSAGQRGFMEEVIREGGGGRNGDGGAGVGEGRDGERAGKGPSIALKMDFGGP